jgi:hypothetical protein
LVSAKNGGIGAGLAGGVKNVSALYALLSTCIFEHIDGAPLSSLTAAAFAWSLLSDEGGMMAWRHSLSVCYLSPSLPPVFSGIMVLARCCIAAAQCPCVALRLVLTALFSDIAVSPDRPLICCSTTLFFTGWLLDAVLNGGGSSKIVCPSPLTTW